MKKLFLVFAVLSLFSCELPPSTEKPQGLVHIWFDDDGRRHRTYTSNTVFTHTIDGVLVKYVKMPSDSLGLNVDLDSLIEVD